MKKNKLLLILLILIIIPAALLYLILKYDNPKVPQSNTTKDIKDITEEKSEKSYTVSMIMVGDNLIHSSIYKDAKERTGNTGYDFYSMYELIKPITSSYDIAYYNQETILGGEELGLSDYPTFNSPYEVGDAMIDAGFNLVSLATNHTLDSGIKAIKNSREYWDKHDNVLAVGSYISEESRNTPQIKEINNISYTMLNYTYGTNGISIPEGQNYLVNVWPTDTDNINNPNNDIKYQSYKEQVKKDVERVRDKVDILIVAMHWGVEYAEEPTQYEIDMANYLSSLGVDIIIGTHPHVIEPITWIDNTLVIYSLGNFISAQYQNKYSCYNYRCTVGLMSSLEITKTVNNTEEKIEIGNIDNELIYTYYNQSTWRGYKVIPFSNQEIIKYLPNYKTIYETYKEIVQRYDNNINVKEVYEG